ncbi:hypothetical protein M758_2G096000, partial [Ceratodon purpureus]
MFSFREYSLNGRICMELNVPMKKLCAHIGRTSHTCVLTIYYIISALHEVSYMLKNLQILLYKTFITRYNTNQSFTSSEADSKADVRTY